MDEDSCDAAATGGHLNALIWLRSQVPPCPWNEWCCYKAARGGHLDVLKWALSEGAPVNLRKCLKAARESKRPEVVQFLSTSGTNIVAS